MRSASLILLIALLAVAPGAARPQVPPRWATAPEPPAMPVADKTGFVTRDSARLYYAVYHRGAGRPVILLHGGLSSSDSWGFEVPLLAGHEVIVMDSRGQGRSTRSKTLLSYGAMASDVVALMDRLHLRRASVVGVSDGGIIGLILAIDHPDRLDKLFCWGANFNTHAQRLSPPDPAIRALGAAYMARMEADYRRLSPTPEGFGDLRSALGRLYESEPNLTSADLGRIRVPTVIADGEYEQFIDPSHTQMLARMIPGARLVIIPKVSHGGALQDPAAFHAAVAALLDERRGPGVH